MYLDYKLESSLFFLKLNGILHQVAKLNIFKIKGEIKRAEIFLKTTYWERRYVLFSDDKNANCFDINIPVLKKDTRVRTILKVNDLILEKIFVLKPHRMWEIHIQNFTHTDVGFTDLPSRVVMGYREDIRNIIMICDETKKLDKDYKYRWNVESGFWLEQAICDLDQKYLKRFKNLIQEKRIELTPFYVPHVSELNDEETLIRNMYSTFMFAKECGVKIETAMASDTPGLPWFLPQILSKSGIHFLSTATNIIMAKPLKLPRPFYWKSLDGSKVLVLDTDYRISYQEGYCLGLSKSYNLTYKKIPEYLMNLENDNSFQFDLLALRTTGSFGDNTPPNINVNYIINEWNKKWEYPKLVISTYTQYFKKFEQKYGQNLETFYGAWPDWWGNYHGSSAFETGINRHTHSDLLEAERLSSILKINNIESYYPRDELNYSYKKIFLADEIMWGSIESVIRPNSLQSKGQRFETGSFVYQAAINAKEIAESAKMAISKIASCTYKFGIIATNSLSWTRSDVVEVTIPKRYLKEKGGIRIFDSTNGTEMVSQLIEPNKEDITFNKMRLAFKAENIPALGFKVFDVIFDSSYENEVEKKVGKTVVENDFYKIKVGVGNSTIISIFDNILNVELVNVGCEYKFDQLIYESPKNPRIFESLEVEPPEDVIFCQLYNKNDWYNYPPKNEELIRTCPENQKLIKLKEGKIYSEIIFKSFFSSFKEISTRIVLNNLFKKITIENYFEKNEMLDTEAIYFSFPFKIFKPTFRISCTGGYFEPESEQLPGSSRDSYTVQKWIDLSDENLEIIWSSIEAPVVELGEINTGKLLDSIVLNNGTIFSYIMNSYWWTNGASYQGGNIGKFRFKYAITSKKPKFDPVEANRFGWSEHVPISATFMEFEIKKSGLKEYKLLKNIPSNVMIVGMKISENGRSMIIRFLEISGQSTEFELKFLRNKIKEAYLTTPIEENLSRLNKNEDILIISIKPFEIVTVRIDFQEELLVIS